MIGVSDGLVKDGVAGQAYILEGADPESRIEGAGLVDGDPAYVDLFRGEMVGILAQVYVLLASVEFYGPPANRAEVDFHCNSRSANGRAENVVSVCGLKRYVAAKYDIAAEIWEVVEKLDELGVTVNFNWVRRHQNEDEGEEGLTRESLLNVDCDLCAGMF